MIPPPLETIQHNVSLKEYIETVQQEFDAASISTELYVTTIHDYIDFQDQTITLEMFAALSQEKKVLKEPLQYENYINHPEHSEKHLPIETLRLFEEYKQAQEKIIFDDVLVYKLYEHPYYHVVEKNSAVIAYFKTKDASLVVLPTTAKTIEDLVPFNLKFKDHESENKPGK